MLNRLCTDQVQSPVKREVQVVEQAECSVGKKQNAQQVVHQELSDQVQSPLKPEVQVVEQAECSLREEANCLTGCAPTRFNLP